MEKINKVVMPMVSVCMITYNHEKFISQAIEGVLMQKCDFPVELVIGDDFSTDRTRSILREYAIKYPEKIKLLLHPYNLGPPETPGKNNFVVTLKECKGKYIALCEGDDYWTDPYKLQKQVDFLEKNPNYSFCFHEVLKIDELGNPIGRFNNIIERRVFTLKHLTRKNFIATCSVVFRRENIEKLPPEFYSLKAGDWAIHVLNAEKGDFVYLPDPMGVYRIHPKGVWTSMSRCEMGLSGIETMMSLNKITGYKYTEEFEEGVRLRLTEFDIDIDSLENHRHLLSNDTYELCKKMLTQMPSKSCAIQESIKAQRKKNDTEGNEYIDIQLLPETLDRYFIRKSIYSALCQFIEQCKGVVLDIGCGEMPYKSIILKYKNISKYIGLDIENPKYQITAKPDVFWDGKRIPLGDNSVDYAIATEVFEHLPNIDQVLKETYRVLKPGGKLFFTVPFLWPIHDNPNDEYRYTPFSLKRHLENAGFSDIEIQATGGWDASLAQMIGLWVKRSPMTDEDRKKFTELLYPFYIELLKREERSKKLTYDDMLNHSVMITGLVGICKKPLRADKTDESILAIVCPQIGAISETFIRKHIEHIAPGKTVVLTGEVIDHKWFSGPIKIIPIQLGFYKFDQKTEQEVIEFLRTHKVTHILVEFGCIGGAVIEVNARTLKLPIFVHFHGQDASEFLRRPDIVSYYRWMGSVVDGVITVSDPMTKRLCEIGIPEEKIRKIHYGVDISDNLATPEKEPCRFIAVTRLVAKKGIMHLLSAFAKLHVKNPTVTLDIIGDGPMKKDVEEFIKTHGLTEAVTLHGSKSNDFVLKKLSESSVYVQHSITDPETGNAEGLPNSILEASMCGLPVIATRHEGIPEAVEHGVTGFLVHEGDVDKMVHYMDVLANDVRLRKQMGLSARKKMLRDGFTTEEMIKKLRECMGITINEDKSYHQVTGKKLFPERVLFVNHNIYPYEFSGTPLSTYNIVKEMRKKGIDVAVLIPDNSIKSHYEKQLMEDFILYKIQGFDKYEAFFLDIKESVLRDYIKSIEKVLEDFSPDIIHINDYVWMPAFIIKTFKELGYIVVRGVCNMEELCYFDAPVIECGKEAVLCSGPESPIKCANCFSKNKIDSYLTKEKSDNVLSKYQEKFNFLQDAYDRWVDGVIFTTKEFKEYFCKFISIPKEKMRVIPRGFDFVHKTEEVSRKKSEDPNKLVCFGYLGNLIHRKGIDVLLKAFTEIAHIDGFRLEIYGIAINEYLEWIKDLEKIYPSKIIYKGQYNNSEIPKILSSIDVAIVPSYFETYNRVVREVLHFGIPVIATDFFGSSIIKDGINGLRIPTGDYKALAKAMEKLISKRELIKRLSEGARETKIPTLSEEVDGLIGYYLDIMYNLKTLQKNAYLTDKLHEVVNGEFVSGDKKGFDKTNNSDKYKPAKEEDNKEDIDVSIIIPVLNNLTLTKSCINSILRHRCNIKYEIIVVDNGSQDGTREYFESLKDTVVCYNRLERNFGFVGGCNFGASRAKGKYLVFLNNDTEVTEGWLDAMIKTFEDRPDCGAVGSKLVYPNGKLQEAGSIIFSDGSGWNYGRGMDPNDPRFNFVREVDYCSAAALAIRKDLWEDIGGFDNRYSPAYYEDADLCFEVRRRGYKVYYQPKSVVIHYEGKTAGIDLSTGFKRYQHLNRTKFVVKWNEELKKQLLPKAENVFKASERNTRAYVLFLDHFFPMFDRASGSLRLFNILKLMKELNFHITFIAMNNDNERRYRPILEDLGIETVSIFSFTKGNTLDVKALSLFLKERNFDYAIIEFWNLAINWIPLLRRLSEKTKIIVDSVDIHFVREIREAELANDENLMKKALKNKESEIFTYRMSDRVWVVTENDKEAIKEYVPKIPIDIVPNVHELINFRKNFDETSDLLFVGNFRHLPNRDAVFYLCKDIFPLIKKELPNVKLFIVGNEPQDDIKALASESIIITGYVEDLTPYLQKARISVAPLRYGAGMKGKIGEALSWGLPVVTTPIGTEGMGLREGCEILVASTAEEFASSVVKLYKDRTLWESLSKNGKRFIEENYSPEAVRKKLKDVFRVDGGFISEFQKKLTDIEAPEPEHIAFPESKKNFSISIVIPAMKNWEYTRACLESVVRYTGQPFEIILVDNGSERPFANEIAKWKEKNPKIDVKHIRLGTNLGFAGGCNRGIEISHGDIIVILNNDAIVTPGWLKSLIKPLAGDEKIGIVGPLSNYVYGGQMVKDCPLKFESPDKVDFGKLAAYATKLREENRDRYLRQNYVIGLCMAVKREVIDKIGGFDERFYPGNFEDDDFCIRAQHSGYQTLICCESFVYHFGNRTFIQEALNYEKAIEENERKLMEKWGVLHALTREEIREKALRAEPTPERLLFPLHADSSFIIEWDKKHWKRKFDYYLSHPRVNGVQLIVYPNGEKIESIQERMESHLKERGISDFPEIILFDGEREELFTGLEGKKYLISTFAELPDTMMAYEQTISLLFV